MIDTKEEVNNVFKSIGGRLIFYIVIFLFIVLTAVIFAGKCARDNYERRIDEYSRRNRELEQQVSAASANIESARSTITDVRLGLSEVTVTLTTGSTDLKGIADRIRVAAKKVKELENIADGWTPFSISDRSDVRTSNSIHTEINDKDIARPP